MANEVEIRITGKYVDQISSGINRSIAGIESFVNLAEKAGRAALAVGKWFWDIASNAAEAGDALDEMSSRTGASVEFLSALDYAAKLAGTDLGQLEIGLRMLAKTSVDAADGSKSAEAAFARVGVSVKDLSGDIKTVEQLFWESIAGIQALKTETEQAAAAQELFGRGGTMLLPIIKQGTGALKEQMEEARKLGLVFSAEAAQDASKFADAQDRLSAAVAGLKRQLASLISPELTALMNHFSSLIINSDSLKASIKSLADEIATSLPLMADQFLGLMKTMMHLAVGMQGLYKAAQDFNAWPKRNQAESDIESAEKRKALAEDRFATAYARAQTEPSGTAFWEKQMAEALKQGELIERANQEIEARKALIAQLEVERVGRAQSYQIAVDNLYSFKESISQVQDQLRQLQIAAGGAAGALDEKSRTPEAPKTAPPPQLTADQMALMPMSPEARDKKQAEWAAIMEKNTAPAVDRLAIAGTGGAAAIDELEAKTYSVIDAFSGLEIATVRAADAETERGHRYKLMLPSGYPTDLQDPGQVSMWNEMIRSMKSTFMSFGGWMLPMPSVNVTINGSAIVDPNGVRKAVELMGPEIQRQMSLSY